MVELGRFRGRGALFDRRNILSSKILKPQHFALPAFQAADFLRRAHCVFVAGNFP